LYVFALELCCGVCLSSLMPPFLFRFSNININLFVLPRSIGTNHFPHFAFEIVTPIFVTLLHCTLSLALCIKD